MGASLYCDESDAFDAAPRFPAGDQVPPLGTADADGARGGGPDHRARGVRGHPGSLREREIDAPRSRRGARPADVWGGLAGRGAGPLAFRGRAGLAPTPESRLRLPVVPAPLESD